MTLYAISNAATLALASTIVALLLVKSAQFISQPFSPSRHFRGSIMVEAAQRFRDELEDLRGRQILYTTLALIFIASFATAVLGDSWQTLGEPATWQIVVTLFIVSVAFGYGVYRLGAIVVTRRKLAFMRDANIATGHRLQSLTSNRNRVFHDVPTPLGTIDNVVVGLHGVYLVDVVAQRPGRDKRVRLVGDEVTFAPGKITVCVADSGNKAKQLAKSLARVVGHQVRVRTVIAAPGWEVESQASDRYLLVNERSVGMLRGWKDDKDYLMNEDVEAIHAHLAAGNPRKRAAA